MRTLPDPRETLIKTGNQLLDVLYTLSRYDETVEAIKKVTALPADDAGAMLTQEFMTDMVDVLTLHMKRDGLLREYIALRTTIEALDAPRPEVDL